MDFFFFFFFFFFFSLLSWQCSRGTFCPFLVIHVHFFCYRQTPAEEASECLRIFDSAYSISCIISLLSALNKGILNIFQGAFLKRLAECVEPSIVISHDVPATCQHWPMTPASLPRVMHM